MCIQSRSAWYADDATVGGSLPHIRGWWERLQEIGPMYGYYPNASKSWLLVKEQHLHKATDIFRGTDVSITSEGRSVLGSPIGTCAFVDKFVDEKIAVWSNELMALSDIAVSQPHAAYAGFIHCISSRWSYLSRTCPNICNKFDVLEQIIRQRLIPSLIDRNSLNDIERELLSLPIRHGGLGINNPSKISSSSYDASLAVSTPLIDLILHRSLQIPYEAFELQHLAKLEISTIRHRTDTLAKDVIYHKLPVSLQKLVDISCEKGASSWLSVIPIQEHGFALHKGAFRDAISLRYGWRPPLLPNNCVCGKSFTVEHAISCPCGGYPSLRHNEIRDFTAHLLTEVCCNVGIEPPLQSLTGESLSYRTSNIEDGARLDVAANGFWECGDQRAFFDIRVFNPIAPSHLNSSLSNCYRKNEQEKKRAYDERVRHIEHGVFSPLVFSTAGGMGPVAIVVYKRLASLISDKYKKSYSQVMRWIRCKINFSLLRSTIMCLRGSRSSFHHPTRHIPIDSCIDLALVEGRIDD